MRSEHAREKLHTTRIIRMEKPCRTHSHTNLAIKFLNVHSAAVNKNTTLLETTLLAELLAYYVLKLRTTVVSLTAHSLAGHLLGCGKSFFETKSSSGKIELNMKYFSSNEQLFSHFIRIGVLHSSTDTVSICR